jgi:tRNA(fMet)-specific endonuclease VapC
MMSGPVILDTNHISFAVRGIGAVRKRLQTHRRGTVALTSVVLAELEYSTLCHPHPEQWDAAWRKLIKDWPVLSFHRDEAAEHAQIRHELRVKPIGERDLLIAAIARCHGLPVATANEEFSRVRGLRVQNWSKQ